MENKLIEKIKGAAELIQDAADAGVNATEAVHRMIARKPYELFAKIDVIVDPVRAVERLQDEFTAGVYQTIRTMNLAVGTVAMQALEQLAADKGKGNLR